MKRIVTVTLNPSLDEWVELPTLRVGQLNRAQGFQRYPGGKGINVSRVLQELGQRSLALTLLGGADGRLFLHLLSQTRMAVEAIHLPGTTRNNYKLITHQPLAFTEINTEGPRVPAAALRQTQRRLLTHAQRASVAVLSGSLPPGVPATIYQRWIRLLKERRVPAVLDASGAALLHGLRARPWLIKPNREEAQALLQQRLSTTRQYVAALRALQRQAELVVLSLGAEGALFAEGARLWQASAPRVPVHSAVGAGDSLIGGFLAGWRRSRELREAFRWGVAAGTATVMTSGTELCHARDVRRLLRRVRVRPLR